MKNESMETRVIIDTHISKKVPSYTYKKFTFSWKNVVAFIESPIPGHCDIVLPGGTFTIEMNYHSVRSELHNFKYSTNATKEN